MKNKNFRYFIIYISVTLFSMLVCAIYYLFSHGETDYHMTFLFVPGACVTAFFLIIFFLKFKMHDLTYYLLNSAFVFLWVYMLLMGVYNIAYVQSDWTFAFALVSGAICLFAIIFEIINQVIDHKKKVIK